MYVEITKPGQRKNETSYTRFNMPDQETANELTEAQRQLDYELHLAENAPAPQRAAKKKAVKAKMRRLYAKAQKLAV